MSQTRFISIVLLLACFTSSCQPAAPIIVPTAIQESTPTPAPEPVLPAEGEIRDILIQMVDKEKRATGMVIGMIAPDEKIIVGYGRWNDTDERVPDGDTLFEIGSISKVFVGTLLADSVRRGEVQLEDAAIKYLPSSVKMPDFQGTPITLLDLATHTSGLPKNMDFPPLVEITEENWVQNMYEFLSTYELTQKPGTSYTYSNLGVTLLAHILELRTGKPYETLLMERIFQPLGMDSTRLTPTDEMLTRLATGHNSVLYPTAGYKYQEPELRYVGGILSSAEDMLKFASAAMGLVETPLLPVFRDATKARRSAYGNTRTGLTWGILEGSHPILFHAGDTSGMHAYLGLDPERQVAVIELANGFNYRNDIGQHLLHPDRYELESYSPRVLPTPTKLPPEVLKSYAGEYAWEGLPLTISVDGDQLRMSIVEDNFTLIALSETRFATLEYEAIVNFTVRNGKATELMFNQEYGPDLTFTRLDSQE